MMKELVNRFKSTAPERVLVVGDVMLDEYITGAASRVSPEAPVLVVKQQQRSWYLGGAANVAANCRSLGMTVDLIGLINDADEAHWRVLALLQQQGITTDFLIKTDARLTTHKTRVLAGHQQCIRIDCEDAAPLKMFERAKLKQQIIERLPHQSIVLLSDYQKGVLDEELIQFIVEHAKALGIMVLVDPKGPGFSRYKKVSVLKPNLSEYQQLVRELGCNEYDSMVVNGQKICSLLALDGLLVTMGEQGIHYISPTESLLMPTKKYQVYDVSGAGDTVFAAIGLCMAQKVSLHSMLMFANQAASITIQKIKTHAVTLDEVVQHCMQREQKIMTDHVQLKTLVEQAQREGRSVVFTNGCFDILHAGHVHLLDEAKQLGDLLIVALNTDDSVVRQGKGPGRPINTLADRMAVIASLASVDLVTSFSPDTPYELIKLLVPNVLVKGSDYKPKDVVGYDIVTLRGGRVVCIDLVENRSTTRTIAHMQRVSM